MSYINTYNNEAYPYEIDVVINPLDYLNLPEWFTDLLLVSHFNENGQPVYKFSTGKEFTNISYYIPINQGWLNVGSDEVIIRNLGTGKVSTMKRSVFTSMYLEKIKLSWFRRLVNKLKSVL